MFSWNEDVDTDAANEALSAALATMPAAIPEIANYSFGPDAGLSEGNFDFAVVGEFNSRDDYATYRDNADHQALIKDHIAGKISARAAVQFDS